LNRKEQGRLVVLNQVERGKKKKEGLVPLLDTPFWEVGGGYLRDKQPMIEGGREEEKIRIIELLHWLLYTGRQGDCGMEQTFEATIEKRDKWYIGWVDAVPGAFSQGRTIKEVEENLKEAVQLILESQRELRDKETSGKTLKRKIQVQV